MTATPQLTFHDGRSMPHVTGLGAFLSPAPPSVRGADAEFTVVSAAATVAVMANPLRATSIFASVFMSISSEVSCLRAGSVSLRQAAMCVVSVRTICGWFPNRPSPDTLSPR